MDTLFFLLYHTFFKKNNIKNKKNRKEMQSFRFFFEILVFIHRIKFQRDDFLHDRSELCWVRQIQLRRSLSC